MRPIEEIINNDRLRDVKVGMDGFSGYIRMPGYQASIIVSNGGGWEHASISPLAKRITPSWDDMCMIKDIVWYDNEEVIQIHPAKDLYVNNMPNCLHLWRCTYMEMVLPPSCFVGIKVGQTQAELKREIRAAYEQAGEVFGG